MRKEKQKTEYDGSKQKERYQLLDGLRGLCLVSMILYHGTYDLAVLFGKKLPWFFETPGYVWQQSICWTFIFLSGFCWSLGSNPLKRGAVIAACGGLVTFVTAVFMPEQIVLFGILTLTGSAMMLLVPLEKRIRKVPPYAGLAGSLLLFAVFRNINRGELGFEGITLLKLPGNVPDSYLLEWLGLPSEGFYSTDYFSMLPWFFLYLSGYFLWRGIGGKEAVRRAMRIDLPLLSRLGRSTLPVYLAHQPALMAVFLLLEKFAA